MDPRLRKLIELGYAAGSIVGTDAAAAGQAAQAATDELKDILRQLVDALRARTIMARPPAFAMPTLRSVPVRCTMQGTSAGPGAGALQTIDNGVFWNPQPDAGITGNPPSNSKIGTANTAEPFPANWIGVVWVQTWATQLGTAQAAALPRQSWWSLQLNRQYVPGFQRQACLGAYGQATGAVAGPVPSNWLQDDTTMACPIILRGGDRMEVQWVIDDLPATVTAAFRTTVNGYRFPETDATTDLRAYLVD